jgi:hypothetical protein
LVSKKVSAPLICLEPIETETGWKSAAELPQTLQKLFRRGRSFHLERARSSDVNLDRVAFFQS